MNKEELINTPINQIIEITFPGNNPDLFTSDKMEHILAYFADKLDVLRNDATCSESTYYIEINNVKICAFFRANVCRNTQIIMIVTPDKLIKINIYYDVNWANGKISSDLVTIYKLSDEIQCDENNYQEMYFYELKNTNLVEKIEEYKYLPTKTINQLLTNNLTKNARKIV